MVEHSGFSPKMRHPHISSDHQSRILPSCEYYSFFPTEKQVLYQEVSCLYAIIVPVSVVHLLKSHMPSIMLHNFYLMNGSVCQFQCNLRQADGVSAVYILKHLSLYDIFRTSSPAFNYYNTFLTHIFQ